MLDKAKRSLFVAFCSACCQTVPEKQRPLRGTSPCGGRLLPESLLDRSELFYHRFLFLAPLWEPFDNPRFLSPPSDGRLENVSCFLFFFPPIMNLNLLLQEEKRREGRKKYQLEPNAGGFLSAL